MLQQTQIAAAIPYYTRFLQTFPSVGHLAAARLEPVLRLWAGLGYYRRARLLHLAARKIARDFAGQFPQEYEQVRSLPGIGDYTARAILSIAYNQPYTALDGNVARVVARLAAIEGNANERGFRRRATQELEGLLSRRRPGSFNQALMELGQTICLPRAPRCLGCPLQTWCQAYSQGKPHAYPRPRTQRAAETRYLASAVIWRISNSSTSRRAVQPSPNGPEDAIASKAAFNHDKHHDKRVALLRGLDEGLLGDLWNFPAAFGSSRAEALTRLVEKIRPLAPGSLRWLSHNGCAQGPTSLAQLRHTITYRSIHVDVYAAETAAAGKLLRWFPLHRVGQSAVSQLARKIAARLTSPPTHRPPSG